MVGGKKKKKRPNLSEPPQRMKRSELSMGCLKKKFHGGKKLDLARFLSEEQLREQPGITARRGPGSMLRTWTHSIYGQRVEQSTENS